jgi:hypothetical protein
MEILKSLEIKLELLKIANSRSTNFNELLENYKILIQSIQEDEF